MTSVFQPIAENMRGAWTAPAGYADPGRFPRMEERSLTDPDAGLGVVFDPPGTARRFLRYPPEFVDDPDGTGLFEEIGTAVYASPPTFLVAANNAALIGYRTLVSEGYFFNDQIYDAENLARYLSLLARTDPFPNEDTNPRRLNGTGQFVLGASGQRWRRFEGTAVILCSQEPSNHGSFLFRVLPKVQALRRLGLTDLPVVCGNIGGSTTALLQLAGLDGNRIVSHDTHAVTVFDRAIVPSLRNPDAFLDRESRALYRGIVEEHGSPAGGGRRLYVSRYAHSRNSGTSRIMMNEDELIVRLASVGFDIVEPETLTIAQQIATFSSADLVVGPSGSGMFNVVFCRPSTKVVDIESENHWIYAHTGLFASCELRYGIFVGRVDGADTRAVHRRWNVDIPALLDRTERFARA